MDVLLEPLILLILAILDIYQFIVIAAVVMTWLFHFNIINYSQQFVRMVWEVVSKLTEPILSRIRNFLPDMGGIDISPIVLLLLVFFAKNVVIQIGNKLL